MCCSSTDAFNDYFIGIGAQDTETPQGNSHYSDYLGNKPNCNLQFYSITNCDVAEIIGNLKPKTSTGIDTISSKLLRQTKDSITESLTIIVNQMLKTGTFPELLKISKVIPLYKKGDNSNLSNYRSPSINFKNLRKGYFNSINRIS